jgi:hypothetical protein
VNGHPRREQRRKSPNGPVIAISTPRLQMGHLIPITSLSLVRLNSRRVHHARRALRWRYTVSRRFLSSGAMSFHVLLIVRHLLCALIRWRRGRRCGRSDDDFGEPVRAHDIAKTGTEML